MNIFMKYPETCIIYGANSCIAVEFAKMIQSEVTNLVLFYHKKTDNISSLFNKKNVTAFSSDICNYEDFITKLMSLPNSKDISAIYFSTIRSIDSKPISNVDLFLANKIINVNIMGAIHFLKGIFLINNRINSTRIVLMGSNVSRTGLPNGAVYSASKAALANLVRSVSIEEGKNNTLINTVSPGPVETNNKDFSKKYSQFRQNYFDNYKKLSSLNKLAKTVDICSIIKYLTSFENNHITGEEFFITGGAL